MLSASKYGRERPTVTLANEHGLQFSSWCLCSSVLVAEILRFE